MSELEKRLQSLGQSIKSCEQTRSRSQQSAEVVWLPSWSELTRGVPNSALRGALFAAIQGKHRQYKKRELLDVQQGIEIRFTGMQLNQSDLDVWEQALHLAQLHPLGSRCHFTARSFLKALGRATGNRDHEWLKDTFARLGGCFVEITHGRYTYGGSLLEFYRDEETRLYILEINPKIRALYTAGWTATDWQQRELLRRKPLALWLHGFLASHANPFPMKVETLHQLSGSRNKDMRGFKRDLKKAFEKLRVISAINGYEFSGDLVTIDRTPSGSQQKHLTKAKSRRPKT